MAATRTLVVFVVDVVFFGGGVDAPFVFLVSVFRVFPRVGAGGFGGGGLEEDIGRSIAIAEGVAAFFFFTASARQDEK
jgi:hypothetical protein